MDVLALTLEGLTRLAYDSGVKVMIFSQADDPNSYEIGRIDGFRIYESPPFKDWPQPERPRQKVNAFIHRRAGHWGF